MMKRNKYIILLLALLTLASCGKNNLTALVGDHVTISAEIPEDGDDLDFIWELTSVPDNSQLINSNITAGETNASVVIIPDVPGSYRVEVSVFQYNDEISTQTFSYDVVEAEPIEEIIAEDEQKEVEDAISDLMAETDEPKWYESDTVAQMVESAEQVTPKPVIETEHPEPVKEASPPSSPPAPKKKKSKSVRGASIPYDKDRFTIQVASKKELEDAKKVAATLIDAGYDAYIQKAVFKETNEIWYRIRVGSYDKRETALAVAESLSSTRPEKAWVDHVRYEY